MKIRLIEEFNPVTGKSTFKIRKYVGNWPFGYWAYVSDTCSLDGERTRETWERIKTVKAVESVTKVIDEATI
jgi:hypothetical protein